MINQTLENNFISGGDSDVIKDTRSASGKYEILSDILLNKFKKSTIFNQTINVGKTTNSILKQMSSSFNIQNKILKSIDRKLSVFDVKRNDDKTLKKTSKMLNKTIKDGLSDLVKKNMNNKNAYYTSNVREKIVRNSPDFKLMSDGLSNLTSIVEKIAIEAREQNKTLLGYYAKVPQTFEATLDLQFNRFMRANPWADALYKVGERTVGDFISWSSNFFSGTFKPLEKLSDLTSYLWIPNIFSFTKKGLWEKEVNVKQGMPLESIISVLSGIHKNTWILNYRTLPNLLNNKEMDLIENYERSPFGRFMESQSSLMKASIGTIGLLAAKNYASLSTMGAMATSIGTIAKTTAMFGAKGLGVLFSNPALFLAGVLGSKLVTHAIGKLWSYNQNKKDEARRNKDLAIVNGQRQYGKGALVAHTMREDTWGEYFQSIFNKSQYEKDRARREKNQKAETAENYQIEVMNHLNKNGGMQFLDRIMAFVSPQKNFPIDLLNRIGKISREFQTDIYDLAEQLLNTKNPLALSVNVMGLYGNAVSIPDVQTSRITKGISVMSGYLQNIRDTIGGQNTKSGTLIPKFSYLSSRINSVHKNIKWFSNIFKAPSGFVNKWMKEIMISIHTINKNVARLLVNLVNKKANQSSGPTILPNPGNFQQGPANPNLKIAAFTTGQINGPTIFNNGTVSATSGLSGSSKLSPPPSGSKKGFANLGVLLSIPAFVTALPFIGKYLPEVIPFLDKLGTSAFHGVGGTTGLMAAGGLTGLAALGDYYRNKELPQMPGTQSLKDKLKNFNFNTLTKENAKKLYQFGIDMIKEGTKKGFDKVREKLTPMSDVYKFKSNDELREMRMAAKGNLSDETLKELERKKSKGWLGSILETLGVGSMLMGGGLIGGIGYLVNWMTDGAVITGIKSVYNNVLKPLATDGYKDIKKVLKDILNGNIFTALIDGIKGIADGTYNLLIGSGKTLVDVIKQAIWGNKKEKPGGPPLHNGAETIKDSLKIVGSRGIVKGLKYGFHLGAKPIVNVINKSKKLKNLFSGAKAAKTAIQGVKSTALTEGHMVPGLNIALGVYDALHQGSKLYHSGKKAFKKDATKKEKYDFYKEYSKSIFMGAGAVVGGVLGMVGGPIGMASGGATGAFVGSGLHDMLFGLFVDKKFDKIQIRELAAENANHKYAELKLSMEALRYFGIRITKNKKPTKKQLLKLRTLYAAALKYPKRANQFKATADKIMNQKTIVEKFKDGTKRMIKKAKHLKHSAAVKLHTSNLLSYEGAKGLVMDTFETGKEATNKAISSMKAKGKELFEKVKNTEGYKKVSAAMEKQYNKTRLWIVTSETYKQNIDKFNDWTESALKKKNEIMIEIKSAYKKSITLKNKLKKEISEIKSFDDLRKKQVKAINELVKKRDKLIEKLKNSKGYKALKTQGLLTAHKIIEKKKELAKEIESNKKFQKFLAGYEKMSTLAREQYLTINKDVKLKFDSLMKTNLKDGFTNIKKSTTDLVGMANQRIQDSSTIVSQTLSSFMENSNRNNQIVENQNNEIINILSDLSRGLKEFDLMKLLQDYNKWLKEKGNMPDTTNINQTTNINDVNNISNTNSTTTTHQAGGGSRARNSSSMNGGFWHGLLG